MLIGIIGNGYVGKATYQLKCKDIDILVYDINPELCIPANIELKNLLECEIIFISVPTPMNIDGSCYTEIVYEVMEELKEIGYKGFVVLRSTVPVGTSDKLGCRFMPEFLTEKNFLQDFTNNKEWIFGTTNSEEDDLFKQKIKNLFTLAFNNKCILYNNITFLNNKEAEMVKMFRNCFLATKVSFCNEIYEYCQKVGVNYSNFINIAARDERITLSHTTVPGHDNKKGFGGTCFPKDTSSLFHDMRKNGMTSYILEAVISRNNNVDRPEQDWQNDKGRATK
jgi:UDPglucose 6-dehydrogenase